MKEFVIVTRLYIDKTKRHFAIDDRDEERGYGATTNDDATYVEKPIFEKEMDFELDSYEDIDWHEALEDILNEFAHKVIKSRKPVIKGITNHLLLERISQALSESLEETSEIE